VTTSAAPRHAWVDVIELEDTVTIHISDPVPAPGSAGLADLTTRDLRAYRTSPPVMRRSPVVGQPAYAPRTIGLVGEVRRTFGVVDSPADTGVLPVHVQAAIRRPSARDRRRHVGSHRASGLLAWLGFGRRGGVR
jgi:hypothetical protein